MATRSPRRALTILALGITVAAASACGFTYEPDPGATGVSDRDGGAALDLGLGHEVDAFAAAPDGAFEPGPGPEPDGDGGAFDGAPDQDPPCDPYPDGGADAGPDGGADAGADGGADPCAPSADAGPPDGDMQPPPATDPI